VKIIYVAAQYDYGDITRGFSYEHHNFYHTLFNMGHEIVYFDFLTEYQQRGKTAMNARLLDIVRAEKPELFFSVLTQDQMDIDIIREVSLKTDTTTFNWFCDDHWRFEKFSRRWAPAFNWVSTTAANALPKYEQIGYTNVIKTQWACNHYLYRQVDVQPEFDVTFIGQPHGTRREVIAALRKAGVNVKVWGHGWEAGRLNQDEMICIFNQSRINLNLSNASTRTGWKRHLPQFMSPTFQQIKGRHFEIPGCGGFLLTDSAENLEDYYVPNEEVALFGDLSELVQAVGYYLAHEAERQRIAKAGFHRTMSDHTYEQRFRQIFRAMGLDGEAQSAVATVNIPERGGANT